MSYVYNMFLPVYNSTKIIKSIKIVQSYDHKCSATFLMVHSVDIHVPVVLKAYDSAKPRATLVDTAGPAVEQVWAWTSR